MKHRIPFVLLLCGLAPVPASAAAPPGRYTVDYANGTAYDTRTQLTWQRAVDLGAHTQADATTYCAALSLGGNDNWRLPQISELLTLVDPTRYSPAMDNAFSGAGAAGLFWSSSAHARNPTHVWVVNFSTGSAVDSGRSGPYRVRCVH